MSLAAIQREVRDVPLGLIDDPELPSRSSMDEQKLDELAASIRRDGLLQPLVLVRVGERYEVIAGHRRRLACGRAGLVAALAIIYPTKSAALEAAKYAENRHREDLNPADEAIWFSELLERDCGGDVDQLCEQLGERRTYVEGRLLLFQGDAVVFQALQRNDIRIGVAHQLNLCSDETYRRYLLHQAIVGGATVAVVSGWIADWKRNAQLVAGEPPPPSEASAPGPVPETDYFRCYVCQRNDDVHLMRPINVHEHCKRAILDKVMGAYNGEQ